MAANTVPVVCRTCGVRGPVKLSVLAKVRPDNELVCRCGSKDIELIANAIEGYDDLAEPGQPMDGGADMADPAAPVDPSLPDDPYAGTGNPYIGRRRTAALVERDTYSTYTIESDEDDWKITVTKGEERPLDTPEEWGWTLTIAGQEVASGSKWSKAAAIEEARAALNAHPRYASRRTAAVWVSRPRRTNVYGPFADEADARARLEEVYGPQDWGFHASESEALQASRSRDDRDHSIDSEARRRTRIRPRFASDQGSKFWTDAIRSWATKYFRDFQADVALRWMDALDAASVDGIWEAEQVARELWEAIMRAEGTADRDMPTAQAAALAGRLMQLRANNPTLSRYLKTGSHHRAFNDPQMGLLGELSEEEIMAEIEKIPGPIQRRPKPTVTEPAVGETPPLPSGTARCRIAQYGEPGWDQCPNCGAAQYSERTGYCSQCGYQGPQAYEARRIRRRAEAFIKVQAPTTLDGYVSVLNWYIDQARGETFIYSPVAYGISRAMNRGRADLHWAIRSMSTEQLNALVERVARAAFNGETGGVAEGHIEQYVYKIADELIRQAHEEGRLNGGPGGQTSLYMGRKLNRRQKKQARKIRQKLVSEGGLSFEDATRAATLMVAGGLSER